MYNTDEEIDRELEALKAQIEAEAQEQDESEAAEEVSDITDSDAELLVAIRAMFEESTSQEEILQKLTDAMNTSMKIFRPEHDVDALLAEEKEIQKVYADFDIANELKSNMKFKRLIANGVNVHSALLASSDAYADAIADGIRKEAKREMAQLLKQGRERIAPGISGRALNEQLDVGKMSDKEFEEIERKVKQNKRVCL